MRLSGGLFFVLGLFVLVACQAAGGERSLPLPPPDAHEPSSPDETPPAVSEIFDELPLLMEYMDKYDRMALEPYLATYDDMPLHEKARVYGHAFASMNGREIRFDPAMRERIERSSQASRAASAYEAKQHLYKPAAPPRVKRKAADRLDSEAQLLRSIPLPGGGVDAPIDDIPADVPPEPRGDNRLETLRPGRVPLR